MFKFINVKILLFVILLMFCSCTFNGTFQGLFSYYNVTKKESEIQFIHLNEIKEYHHFDFDSAKVIVTNGVALKSHLKKYENSLVYIWSPRCKSKYCYPLNILQDVCNQEDIKLFVVAEYYDSYYMSRYYDLEHSLRGIDVKYYKTNLTSGYLSKFIVDLTNGMYSCGSNNENNCSFLSFHNGKFENAFEAIEQITKN